MATKRVAIVVAIAAVLAACSSSNPKALPVPTTSTTAGPGGARSALTFRLVLSSLPYVASTVPPRTGAGTGSCENGKRVTPDAAARDVVLADARKSACYVLGPVLLDGRRVTRVSVEQNLTTAQWETEVHFDGDDFVTKVAGPYVGREIAVVIDGVVESVPTVQPGITGSDVTISGDFDRTRVRQVAAEIAPAGVPVVVVPPAPPVTRPVNAYTTRCAAFGRGLTHVAGAGASRLSPALVVAAFARAHEAVPPPRARLRTDDELALCYFMPVPVPASAVPTCHDGHIVIGALATDVLRLYAVDTSLNGVRLPPIRYLFPTSVTPPTSISGC